MKAIIVGALLVTAIYDIAIGFSESSIGDLTFGAGCGFLALGYMLSRAECTEASANSTPRTHAAPRTISLICAGVLILAGAANKGMA
ncbi:hypothetical protein [Massilia sp. DD77]|uniref:hypothetical protein n=1 Tax=Massilia sp. DD77 TaxID=3109349 RepID=UPI002FFE1911